jgi:hypothetical protein
MQTRWPGLGGAADQSSEGGADVINVLEDVFERKIDAQIPCLEEVPEQGGTETDSRIFLVASRGAGFGCVHIGGAEVDGPWNCRRQGVLFLSIGSKKLGR